MADIFGNKYIGTVVKLDKEKRLAGVYIPKLMSAMYDGDASSYKFPTNAGLTLDALDKNISATVTKTNYLWVGGYYKNSPLPEIGSKVRVEFIDGSPLMPFWRSFDYNGDYQVIEEERYANLFNLQVGDKTETIKESDSVKLVFPKTYNVTKTTENKTTTYRVLENFDFYKHMELEKAISNLQKSMEYLEQDKLNTFVTNINNLVLLSSITSSTGWFKAHLGVEKQTVLNNIDAIDYTKYLLSDYTMIKDRVTDVRSRIASDSGNLYDLQVELEKFLKPYNKSVDEYVSEIFNNDKNIATTNILKSDNLLDANKLFTYYNTLLVGLKDTYNAYSAYVTAFNNLSSSVKTSLASTIHKPLIDTNIRIAFNKALTSTSPSNVESYLTYIKDMFPTKATITYKFSTDGAEYETVQKNTNKIFALTDSTDAQVDYNGSTTSVNNISTVPLFPVSSDPVVISKFATTKWVDESNTDIFNSYYLIKNITAKPHHIGCYITYNDNTEQLVFNIVNDDNFTDCTYTLNGVASTISAINTYINNKTNGNTTIVMNYDTNKTITLTISNNNSATVAALIDLIGILTNVTNTNADEYYTNIVQAEALYSRLDNTNKALITNYSTLTAARTSYDTYYTNKYISLISDVPTTETVGYDYVYLANMFDNMTYAQQQIIDTDNTRKAKVNKIIEFSGLLITRKTE